MKEEIEDETSILICVRVSEMPPVFGSVKAKCEDCKLPVWVSVSGQKAIAKDKTLKPFCMECAFAKMKDDDDLKASIVPGAIDELKQNLGKVRNN
jgi:hypothetical protein